MEKKNYRVEKTYFKNNPNYGRTTTLIDKRTNKSVIVVMGIASIKDCLNTITYREKMTEASSR